MVKSTETVYLDKDKIDSQAWLSHLENELNYPVQDIIRHACILSELTGQSHGTETGQSCFATGLDMAEILADMSVNTETIASALIYACTQYADLSIEDINEQLNPQIGKLVAGVERMNAIHDIHHLVQHMQDKPQTDNLRKMLLAMVDDPRIVLIKLAERLNTLRHASHLSQTRQHALSQEAMNIYAPLANRLGIGHIKWELEDLAFRYLNPERYKEIAKGLNEKRLDRDRYVQTITTQLEQSLTEAGIASFDVYGRSKHIHSIYRKMQRKNIPLQEIYDTTALRILVDNIEDCYQALSIAHSLWKQIPDEFDDYISNPKSNGYRSLHTAVSDEEGKHFEVQIRTRQMHEEAELGFAAHWKYKEGVGTIDSHEQRINWLRDVLTWHQEVAAQEGVPVEVENEFLDDRIYVFSPQGDVIELPHDSTPLDFAYHIHSQVGHRCRGARVDGKMVNLTRSLNTGETIEILTSKHPKPSRDWLNPHLGYLTSSRAKAKVLHWFKQQDFDKNHTEGHAIVERELTKLRLKDKVDDLTTIARRFNFKKVDDLYAAIGRGDIRVTQLLAKITAQYAPKTPPPIPERVVEVPSQEISGDDIYISGVGNLLTHIAKCCHPVPGDEITGYITLGKGISIHRSNCNNILNLTRNHKARLIAVSWQTSAVQKYPVDIIIKAYDRAGLLKDITHIVSNESANVIALNTYTDPNEHLAYTKMTVELTNLSALSRLIDKIRQLTNVIDVSRVED